MVLWGWLTLLVVSGSCEFRPRQSQPIDEADRIWRTVAKLYRGDPASFDNPQRDRELLIEQTIPSFPRLLLMLR